MGIAGDAFVNGAQDGHGAHAADHYRVDEAFHEIFIAAQGACFQAFAQGFHGFGAAFFQMQQPAGDAAQKQAQNQDKYFLAFQAHLDA